MLASGSIHRNASSHKEGRTHRTFRARFSNVFRLGVLVTAGTVSFLGAEPELPRVFIDTTFSESGSGVLTYVPPGGDLQAAINKAQSGDTILLAPGVSYVGAFVLPAKSGSERITIRTLAMSQLPGANSRITSSYFAALPKIVSPDTRPAISVPSGSSRYRLIGLEITTSATMTYQVVSIEGGSHITIDRCYIHATPTASTLRGVLADGDYIAVVNSHIDDIHWAGVDSQAIGAAKSTGPFKISNNFLEGAAENVMFGGTRAPTPGTTPSDIEITNNHFYKRLEWKGSQWTIKNLLEFKNAQRVLVEGNLFENIWPAAQRGYAILMTVRTSDSGDWAKVNDITIRRNTFENVYSGFALQGWDDQSKSGIYGESKRIRVTNNVVRLQSATESVGVLQSFGTEEAEFSNNTFGPDCRFSIFFGGSRAIGLNYRITNNYLCRQPYGDAMAFGIKSLQKFIPETTPLETRFVNNVNFVAAGDPLNPTVTGNRLVTTKPFTDASLMIPTSPEYANVGADIPGLAIRATAAKSGADNGSDFRVIISNHALAAGQQSTIGATYQGKAVAARLEITPAWGTLTAANWTSSLFTAPATIPSTVPVRVCAYSAQVATPACDAILLMAPPSLSLVAPTTIAAADEKLQMRAVVMDGSSPIAWSIEPAVGSITSEGLYIAPAQVPSLTIVRVTATATNIPGLTKSLDITLQPPTVKLNLSSVSLIGGQSAKFIASVTGTQDKRVIWSMQPADVGPMDSAALGVLDQTGSYVAPSVITAARTIRVTATHGTIPTLTATALITLQPLSVSVTPGSRTMLFGDSLLLWPTVTGTNDKRYVWKVEPEFGTVDQNVYRYLTPLPGSEPQLVKISAVSVVDPSKSASTVVTLLPLRVKIHVSDSLSIKPGMSRYVTAAVFDASSAQYRGIEWEVLPSIGTYDLATGLYTAPPTIEGNQQTVTFKAKSTADPGKSATVTLLIYK